MGFLHLHLEKSTLFRGGNFLKLKYRMRGKGRIFPYLTIHKDFFLNSNLLKSEAASFIIQIIKTEEIDRILLVHLIKARS